MSKARDALQDLVNETEIGYKWEDLQFYIDGKFPTKTQGLRPAIQDMVNLLEEAYAEKMYNTREPEQLKLNLQYKN